MARRATPYDTARDCGRFTRSLAAETFQRHDMRPMRDHFELVSLWAERPGFWDGYMETQNDPIL